MRRLVAVVALIALAAVPAVSAEDWGESLTWLALETSKAGKSRDLIRQTIEEDGPMYDELLNKGSLLSWGIAIPINHAPDDEWNFMLWATMPGWKEVGDLQAGFESLFAQRSPQEMAASMQAYNEATVGGTHHDWIVRHHVRRYGDGDVRPRYMSMSYWKARPGMEGQLTELYKKAVSPIMDRLVDDGTVQGYGIATQDLHTESGWTHVTWASLADLGAMDTIADAMTAGFTAQDMAEFAPLHDWEAHRDQVVLIVHVGGSEPEMKPTE